MGSNRMDEILVTFFTNEKVLIYLEQISRSGLYGRTVSDAIERIVCGTIEDMIATGQLDTVEIEGGANGDKEA